MLRTRFTTKTFSTLNPNEASKFRSLSWWDLNGACQGLHSMNRLRVPFIRTGLTSEPSLTGFKILDVGSGGGILSESLARLGASVVGLDVTDENIRIAVEHRDSDSKLRDSQLRYVKSTVEDYFRDNPNEKFDAVVASEVIEHVDNPSEFISTCSKFLVPNGSFFLTTLNRTTRSWLGAIVAAESILRLLPSGTHDWNKFVTPEELQTMLSNSECEVRKIHGMFYIPFLNRWNWISDTSVNYAIHAIKKVDALSEFSL